MFLERLKSGTWRCVDEDEDSGRHRVPLEGAAAAANRAGRRRLQPSYRLQ